MLKLDEHENTITELSQFLNIEGVDSAKVSLLLQSLRNNYTEVSETISNNNITLESNAKSIEEFKSTNMKLLSQLGTQYSELLAGVKKEKEKEVPKENETQVKSIDDLAKEFI